MQSRRNAKAAKRFFRKLLKGLRYVPRVLGDRQTGQLRGLLTASSWGRWPTGSRGISTIAPRTLNQPTRQRERAMKRFKLVRHAQRFLSAFSVHLRALSTTKASAGARPNGAPK